MTDKNDQEEALAEFLRKELAGVDLEHVCFEPSIAADESSGDPPESDSAPLSWRDLEELLSWSRFLIESDDSVGFGLLGVIAPEEGEA